MSLTVVTTLDFFVGIKEFLGKITDIIPPSTSIPKLKGVASIITKPSVYLDCSPPLSNQKNILCD